MNTILVMAHQDDGQEARLQVALDLARALGGHLGCMAGMASPIMLNGEVDGEVAVAEGMLEESLRKTANEVRLKARLARENVAWNWIDASGFLGDSFEAASDLADLIVVSLGFDQHEHSQWRGFARHLPMRLSRPILAVPQDTVGLDTSGTALVTWDGLRPAYEALRDAVPLLKLSHNVILFDIREPVDNEAERHLTPGLAEQYLLQHGINATVVAHRQPDEAVGTTILDKAHEVDAAYIVMGADGRKPAIEAILGGVTRLLATSDLPLFMAHG